MEKEEMKKFLLDRAHAIFLKLQNLILYIGIFSGITMQISLSLLASIQEQQTINCFWKVILLFAFLFLLLATILSFISVYRTLNAFASFDVGMAESDKVENQEKARDNVQNIFNTGIDRGHLCFLLSIIFCSIGLFFIFIFFSYFLLFV